MNTTIKRLAQTAALCVASVLGAGQAFSQTSYGDLLSTPSGEYNSRIQGIVTGGISGTYIQIGRDLGELMSSESGLRLMTLVGEGSATNVLDLLKRVGVDFAIVQSDVIAAIEQDYPDNTEIAKLAYVAKIYNEEIHLLGRADAAPKSIADLEGLRVNIGANGSGTQVTSRLILGFLGIEVEEVTLSNTAALAALQAGEIDAMLFVAGRPSRLLSDIEPDDGLTLLDIPFLPAVADTYSRAEFGPQDYPNLIDGKFVPTLSVGAILVVYDNFVRRGERYANIVEFVETFFANIDTLQNGSFHSKWQEIDIQAEVPGWNRFSVAQELLDAR